MKCIIWFLKNKILYFVCDDSHVETPLPIPNREVKHMYADNSLGEDKELQTFFLQ